MMMRSGQNVGKEDKQSVIWKMDDRMKLAMSHIFFHRAVKNPTVSNPDTSVQEILFPLFVKLLSNSPFFRTTSGNSICPFTLKAFRIWIKIQPDGILDPNELSAALETLGPGESLPLYISQQNAGLIFHVPKEPHPTHSSPDPIILSTWAPSQSSETVMSASGDLVASFPGNSIHLSRTQLLKSNAFAEQMEIFHRREFEEASDHSKKAGRIVPEIREVKDPLFITQWLPAFLSDGASSICSHEVAVIKKIRDDVIYQRGHEIPWRRSGFWMTLKVVLQLSLTQELGEREGLFCYKIIMLSFLCQIAHSWTKEMEPGVGVQVLRKLTRRILKLDHGLKTGKFKQDSQYLSICRRVCTKCEWSLEVLHAHLDGNWKAVINTQAEERAIKYKIPENLDGLTRHKLKQLWNYLKSIHPTSVPRGHDARPASKDVPRIVFTSTLNSNPTDFKLFPCSPSIWATRDEESTGILLHDFEVNICELEIVSNSASLPSSYFPKLVGLFKLYLDKGKSYYKSDPVGSSKMLLTFFQIIKIMDASICDSSSPLLKLFKSHRPGVRIEVIPQLLLTTRDDLMTATRIEEYFENRKQEATFPSLIEEEHVSRNSFPVRYANNHVIMQELKRKIQAVTAREIQEKEAEVVQAKERFKSLTAQAQSQEHSYSTGIKRRHKKRTCCKCRLEAMAKAMRVEKPLPTLNFQQDAVLFELGAPAQICCLRDVLFLFEQEINPDILKSGRFHSWTAQSDLQSHVTLDPLYRNPILVLGSSQKAVVDSHYKSLHPEDHELSSFISENGFNCVFGVEGKVIMTRSLMSNVKSFTTLSVEAGSEYGVLQKYLANTSHTENEILANQIKCPQKLSLGEFRAFGTLRAGHRLQWHNIYRAMATGTLTLRAKSVFNLICQAIWEGGPRDFENSFWRESHESLRDPFFIKEFLRMLEMKIMENSKNWDGCYALVTAVVILNKIQTVNLDLAILVKVVGLLLASRKIALGWCSSIEDQITKMSSATVDQTEINGMRLKLIQVGICVGLTFDGVVVRNDEDYADWLLGMVKIQDNISLSDSTSSTLPISIRNSLRQVRRIGIILEAELDSTIIKTGLQKFLKSHWNPIDGRDVMPLLEFNSIGKSDVRTRVYSSTAPNYEVRMDIICGNFTVNGSPVGKLPDSIRQSSEFERVFGGMIFEVTPTVGPYPSMRETLYSYNGRKYTFAQLGSGQVIITETFESKHQERFQLIPHEIFSDELPYRLVHNYSHWCSQDLNLVQFRPVRFQDSRFLDPPEFTLNLISRELTEELGSGRKILDINTHAWAELSQIFQKLEHKNHILIFSDGKELTVDLPRSSLHFTITKSGILSKEYGGMKVCENDSLGTLVGLRNRLLLVSTSTFFEQESIVSPILLVPHGEVEFEGGILSIDTRNPSIPEYFAYEVDPHLGRIKAGQSHCGWLYLAYLHACTSHPLADPFTRMTGTESALQLLQSASCWSGEPLSPEMTKILQSIAKLSPQISYYPNHLKSMQMVKYPQGVHPQVAHDAFRFIAEILIDDSERMAFLFRTEFEKGESGKKEDLGLWRDCARGPCERAYHRNSSIYNEPPLSIPTSC